MDNIGTVAFVLVAVVVLLITYLLFKPQRSIKVRNSDAPSVIIIGGGLSGICLAVRLKAAGVPFTIYEKGSNLGGTWRCNTYPGAGCDVLSHLYSFSFYPNPFWSRAYSKQPEILDYINSVVSKYQIEQHAKLNTRIVSVQWQPQQQQYKVQVKNSDNTTETVYADFVVSAVGQLSEPMIPNLPGQQSFTGYQFHSASWNHQSLNFQRSSDTNTTNYNNDISSRNFGDEKRSVAIVGNAASAVQIVPTLINEMKEKLKVLYIFSRTPNFIVRKPDFEFSSRTKNLFHSFPFVHTLYRWYSYLRHEFFYFILRHSFLRLKFSSLVRSSMKTSVPPPSFHKIQDLIPNTPENNVFGCKRTLVSSDFLESIAENDNVQLISDKIECLNEKGIRTKAGYQYDVDTVVYATGFQTSEFLNTFEIKVEGFDHKQWREDPYGYLAMAIKGVPNFMMLYGPNSNLGHSSIIFMMECQAEYVTQCLVGMSERRIGEVMVKEEKMKEYCKDLERRMKTSSFATGCRSWYTNSKGRVVNNLPMSTIRYWFRTRTFNWADYNVVGSLRK